MVKNNQKEPNLTLGYCICILWNKYLFFPLRGMHVLFLCSDTSYEGKNSK